MNKLLSLSFPILFVLASAACSKNTTTALSCTSTAAATASTSGTLTVTCSGGTAPYTISNVLVSGVTPTVSGTTTAITSSTTLTLTSSSTLTTAAGTYTVTDSGTGTGSVTATQPTDGTQQIVSESFSFTSTSSISSTGCTITPSTATPALNQPVTFSLIVSSGWGTAPYTFSNFTPGGSSVVTQAITAISSTQYQAAAEYTVAGLVTPLVDITDSTGLSGSCSTSVTVSSSTTVTGGSLTCTAILSPTAALHGTPISATAYVSGNVGATEITGISYPTASGMTGYFTNPMNAVLEFPIAGVATLVFTVVDLSDGQTASCSATETAE